jgi:hypothetical protein
MCHVSKRSRGVHSHRRMRPTVEAGEITGGGAWVKFVREREREKKKKKKTEGAGGMLS